MRTNIYKAAIVAVIVSLVSYPVIAAKPPTTQSLLSGPIPVNPASITQTLSCNLINQASFTSLITRVSLCDMSAGGGVSCLAATPSGIDSGASVQVNLASESSFNNAATVFCMVNYEGSAGEMTGTACLSDYVNGAQTCLPLEPGQYQGEVVVAPIP